MESFDISPCEKSPDLPLLEKQRAISGTAITRRPKAAMPTQLDPASSPPVLTQSGLTPNQPRQRRSSVNLPVPDDDAPREAALIRPEPSEESHCEMDTPTKKPARRARRNPSGSNKRLEPSPLRTTAPPGPNVVAGYEAAEARRVSLFARSHTSPETQNEAERKGQRPSAAERSASVPTTPSKKLSGAQLDSSMAKLIRNGPSKDTECHLKDGGLYLFHVPTKRNRGASGQDWPDRKGRAGSSQRDNESMQAPEEHLALHGNGREYSVLRPCLCTRRHREYFEVSEKIAVEVFPRWRDFCKKRPWDNGGTIKTVWGKRLDARAAFDGPGQDFDHGKFGRHWGTYTMPWLVERVLSDAIHQGKRWFPNRWQAVAVAEMFTIIFLSPASVWVHVWMAAVAALLLIDTVVIADLHATASVVQLMEGGLQDELTADAKGLAPEASQGETPPRHGTGGDAWSETVEEDIPDASDGASSVGPGDPMDVDRDDGCQESTDEEDRPGGSVCSPASLATATAEDEVLERPRSLELKAQVMSGEREVIDLTYMSESD
ncbi:uncharacterized protein GLRG_09850 [Colletotrichum graminicola M1.001]|uniref:Uncharacterized protein n=1 Tax=Colletotrichum graminicola (strain M1.001 / M2 / FGSC 10212) TaxID=645133 RepID=E3QV16_COLGM|nr:uncharacterized protein GLRG_09850 [Colletotrichum graminicola M1.001]EFQ34706.1 hypothetical protein GLRG_09850 [Colletotrichum graminicola M1.001]